MKYVLFETIIENPCWKGFNEDRFVFNVYCLYIYIYIKRDFIDKKEM